MNLIKSLILTCCIGTVLQAATARITNKANQSLQLTYQYQGKPDFHTVPLITQNEFVEIPDVQSLNLLQIHSLEHPDIAPIPNLAKYLIQANRAQADKGIQLTVLFPETTKAAARAVLQTTVEPLAPLEKLAAKRTPSFWFNAFPFIANEIAAGKEIQPWKIFRLESSYDFTKQVEPAYQDAKAHWQNILASANAEQSAQANKVIRLLDAAYNCLKTKDCTTFDQLQDDMTSEVAPEII